MHVCIILFVKEKGSLQVTAKKYFVLVTVSDQWN